MAGLALLSDAGAVGRAAWGAKCGGLARIRVFSKKLFGRGGALFRVVWGTVGPEDWIPASAGMTEGCGGAFFG